MIKSPSSLLSPVPAGVPDNREAVQKIAPLSSEKDFVVDGKHVTMPTPFEVYSAEFSWNAGLVPLDKLKQELRGTGLEPIVIVKDGKEYGSVMLGINRIDDSSIPDQPGYNEAISGIMCVNPALPATAQKIQWSNYATALLPLFEGAAFYAKKLVLDNPNAIELGRDVLAFDKETKPAKLTFAPPADGKASFEIVNARNQLVAKGAMPEDWTPEAMTKGFTDLGMAAQAANVALAPPPPPGTPFPGLSLSRDPLDPQHPLKAIPGTMLQFGPTVINQVTDRYVFGSKDEISKQLKAWGYQPAVVCHMQNVAGVWQNAIPATLLSAQVLTSTDKK